MKKVQIYFLLDIERQPVGSLYTTKRSDISIVPRKSSIIPPKKAQTSRTQLHSAQSVISLPYQSSIIFLDIKVFLFSRYRMLCSILRIKSIVSII